MKKISWKQVYLPILLLMVVVSLTFWVGCENEAVKPLAPTATQETVIFNRDNPQIQAVMAIQDRHTPALMQLENVVGTATGLTPDGQPAILVLTKTAMATQALQKGSPIPADIEGVPVVIEVTGVIRPMKVKPPTVSHTAKQTPPIQLGTSGGWRYDLANGYCCGGTLGSLIKIGSTQYILSNYHVFMADIIAGGNNRVAAAGDPVIQPGLIDVNCTAANAQDVATLVGNWSLPGSNVDAAIAQVIPGMVRTDGAILEIGTLSASTVAASIGQAVKKSGRTTGLTRSTVSGLNGTVNITYENECAGGTAFTKTFTGQIIIANRRSAFLNSGDSGSLMVEDVTTNPRAIGLLFAGGTSTAIANPIGQVLSYFGATMVGN
ncbi:S1 family peptidase [candidate division KSB1 bacterium]|nr:S1 family peptidase [candidate division KSB1 bacterium]